MVQTWKTRLIHPKGSVPNGFRSLATPVHRGSTTLFKCASAMTETWNHDETPYTYGVYGTPTTLTLAARLAELEGAYRCFITPGGQSAIVLVYLAHTSSGDHVLVPETVYGPSRAFANNVLARYGVEVEYYDPLIGAGIERLIRANTKLVWCESPGSLTMDMQDVPAIVAAAHSRGVAVALDNTWAAGVLFDAFRHNVDVSVQALTKYIGGHSDLLLGSVSVRDESEYRRIGVTWQQLGLVASPDDSSLALRGLNTLAVRLSAIERSACMIAQWLVGRKEIESVLHPALPSCPGHDFWVRDFSGSSGVFSVVFRPPIDRDRINSFIDHLELFKIGFSWGGVVSLVALPDLCESPSAARYGDRLVRFSIGLEATEDLIEDLSQALSTLANSYR
jgi:cysteine-S-conjugate beta-lyase